MYGFKTPAGQAARKGFARKGEVPAPTSGDEGEDQSRADASGPVRGPGTGTSDDVQTAVPEGTYIMPADSTAKIGEQRLASMGFTPGAGRSVLQKNSPRLGFKGGQGRPAPEGGPGRGFKPAGDVPVNLSNGEFKLSPEQVHAIGVQVLEGLKAATHETAEEAAEKYEQDGEEIGEDQSRPDLFFADGGLVQDPNKRPGATGMTYGDVTSASIPQRQAPARSPNAGFSTAPAPVPPAAAPQSPAAASTPASATAQPRGFLGSLGTAYGATIDALTPSPFENRANAIRDKNREGLIAEPTNQAPSAPTPQQQAAPVSPTPATVVPATPPATPAATPPNATAPARGFTVSNTSAPDVKRIDQKGQSPLFTNVDPATSVAEMKGNPVGIVPAGVNPFGGSTGSADVSAALQAAAARGDWAAIRDHYQQNGGTWQGKTAQQDATDSAIREMLTAGPHSRATALGFVAGGRDASMRQTQAQREQDLRQQEIQGRQDIAGQELGIKREAQDFQTRAAQRQEALQARYEAAKTPEERAIIAQQIRDLAGKESSPKDNFATLGGGQEWDATAGAMRNVPQRLVDLRTGKEVGGGQVQQQPKTVTSGQVINGYRFKGGDPNKQSSWEKA